MAAITAKSHAISPHANHLMLVWMLGCIIAAFVGAALLVAICQLPTTMLDNGVFSEPTFRYLQPMLNINQKADLQGLS